MNKTSLYWGIIIYVFVEGAFHANHCFVGEELIKAQRSVAVEQMHRTNRMLPFINELLHTDFTTTLTSLSPLYHLCGLVRLYAH